MSNPRTSTPTLIGAMRILANDIQSEDGVANAAIAEAADRMEEMRGIITEAVDDLMALRAYHKSINEYYAEGETLGDVLNRWRLVLK